MDETAKIEARNYLSAAGFFVIAAFYLLHCFHDNVIISSGILNIILGSSLLLTGTLLIVLRKRDVIAILFMMISFYMISIGFNPEFVGWVVVLCSFGIILLTLLITLTGKDKIKWILIPLPLLMFILALVTLLTGTRSVILNWIVILFAFYLAFSCASERLCLPGRKLLTADEETDFRASGSVLGYILFAAIGGSFALFYAVNNPDLISFETVLTLKLIGSILMAYVAVLLFAVGKMRFTPVLFLLTALTLILSVYAEGLMIAGCGILFIVVGLFAILRKESRILPGIMLIFTGTTAFISASSAGLLPSIPLLSVILNGIPCLIAIYLAFVVYSQRNLPKF